MVATLGRPTLEFGYCRPCDVHYEDRSDCEVCNRPLQAVIYAGYCRTCKKYFETKSDFCPTCQRQFIEKFDYNSELQVQYGKALMSVQPYMDPVDSPELWERLDQRINWSAPTNPMFKSMADNALMRKAVRALRGFAAQKGVLEGPLDPGMGTERLMNIDGQDWLMFEDTRGKLTRIRQVPKVEDSLASLPSDWTGKEPQASAVLQAGRPAYREAQPTACPVCSLQFQSGNQMTAHRRAAHPSGQKTA